MGLIGFIGGVMKAPFWQVMAFGTAIAALLVLFYAGLQGQTYAPQDVIRIFVGLGLLAAGYAIGRGVRYAFERLEPLMGGKRREPAA